MVKEEKLFNNLSNFRNEFVLVLHSHRARKEGKNMQKRLSRSAFAFGKFSQEMMIH
jgi:hypothetical protein